MSTEVISHNPSPSESVVKSTTPTEPIRLCDNCQSELDGPFCGTCGQPEQSMIRFFGSVIMHFLDDIFGFDSRAGRTLFPLIFRPGFLTNEYIRGRRVHYVPPVRLYFFMSIVFFLLLGFFTDDSMEDLVSLQKGDTKAVIKVTKDIDELRQKMAEPGYVLTHKDQQKLTKLLQTRIEKQRKLRRAINEMQQDIDDITARQKAADYVADHAEQLSKTGMLKAVKVMRENLAEAPQQYRIELVEHQLQGIKFTQQQALAQDRVGKEDKEVDEELAGRQEELEFDLIRLKKQLAEHKQQQITALTKGEPVIGSKPGNEIKDDHAMVGIHNDGEFTISFGEEGFEWLSDEQNKRLRLFTEEMGKKANNAFEQDASPLIKQVMGVLPQAMFFLLPIFALLLKIVYLFSKRFYMEHLTVALHSHAFLFMVLILLTLLAALEENMIDSYVVVGEIAEFTMLALLFWVPIYLFLMQKRVYRQGLFSLWSNLPSLVFLIPAC